MPTRHRPVVTHTHFAGRGGDRMPVVGREREPDQRPEPAGDGEQDRRSEEARVHKVLVQRACDQKARALGRL